MKNLILVIATALLFVGCVEETICKEKCVLTLYDTEGRIKEIKIVDHSFENHPLNYKEVVSSPPVLNGRTVKEYKCLSVYECE